MLPGAFIPNIASILVKGKLLTPAQLKISCLPDGSANATFELINRIAARIASIANEFFFIEIAHLLEYFVWMKNHS